MEEWHTLTHDIELLTHPETPTFTDGRAPNESNHERRGIADACERTKRIKFALLRVL